MKIEFGIGWVASTTEPAQVRSARPGEYAAEIVRLRAALDEIAVEIPGKLPPGWVGECFQSISDILSETRKPRT